jgi:methyltransferase family protein
MRQGYLLKHEFIPMLDFGCGKCHSVNNEHLHIDGYDPHYRPDGIPEGKRYQIIVCNYVLCTLPKEERAAVLKKIQFLLSEGGVAYISVRNDKPKQGWGLSSKGTYQGRCEHVTPNLIYKNSQFRIYQLTKKTRLV